MPARLLTVDDTAAQLTVSRRTVYQMIARGSLAYVQVEGRKRIEQAAIDAYIRTHRHTEQPITLEPAPVRVRMPRSIEHLPGVQTFRH